MSEQEFMPIWRSQSTADGGWNPQTIGKSENLVTYTANAVNRVWPGSPCIFTKGCPRIDGYSKVLWHYHGSGEEQVNIPVTKGDPHPSNVTLLWAVWQHVQKLGSTSWDNRRNSQTIIQMGVVAEDGTLLKLFNPGNYYFGNYPNLHLMQIPVDKMYTWACQSITQEMLDDGFYVYTSYSRRRTIIGRPAYWDGTIGGSTGWMGYSMPSIKGAWSFNTNQLNS